MAIFDWLNKQLDDLQEQGHTINQTVESFRKDYSQQADEAKQLLRDKQALEREERKSQKLTPQ